MKVRRRAEIEIHTETLLRSRNGPSACAICEACGGKQVRVLTVDEAARFAGLTARKIYRLIEAGRLHFHETADGFVLICRRSVVDNA